MQVVAFQNQKGGVGKSTLSLLVAEQLAQIGKKVIFLDNDRSEVILRCQLAVLIRE